MSDILVPEQVKAARALLAWSQQDLAKRSHVATSTIADFERGVRTPVANNAQAIRDSFEAEGLQFFAGGVVEKAMLPQSPSVHPGGLMRWVNATDLSQWAERRDAQSAMPELIRRLIFATVGPAADVHFPSDESVQHGGWDGQCRTGIGAPYVPPGDSVWEIGTQRTRIGNKANDDFAKRSENPLGYDPSQTTFVFATPQRFSNKADWVAQQRALGKWRDVVLIDADDLVHWLEMCPAVAQWLSVKVGRRPVGLRNLEEVWSEWTGATTIPITADVLLTGRGEDQIAVLRWLRERPQLFSLQADDPEEAFAFLHAAISPLPECYRLWHWSRCVVVGSNEVARQLVGLGTPLIIVLSDPEPGVAQRLVDDGHHVFSAYGSGIIANSSGLRRLHRPWKFDLKVALVGAGMDEEAAHTCVHASGRSITVLRRLKPVAPHNQLEWARKAPSELIAAMFAGAWVDTSSQDRMIISELADCSYEQFEAVLAPLAASVGGPLVRSGNLWKVVSLKDLWMQIGGQITTSQLERFETTFHKVLGKANPRFATRPKSIYYEAEGEFEEQPSSAIRGGFTEATIAMAVLPGDATVISDIRARADRIVRKLFQGAGAALWWSLSNDFRNLAEAAPNAFLDAVDTGLEGDNPPILSLFRSDEGMMYRTEYLSNLLWGLEVLARSSDYLAQAALLLVRLHEIDPGGRWSNRPFPSLRRIFVSWSPQTYATPAERLKVIDTILRRHPSVGWKLLLAISPRFHDITEPSARPNWRDFTPDGHEEVTLPVLAATTNAIGQRLLKHVGCASKRWLQLLSLWSNFDSEWRKLAVEQLTVAVRVLDEPDEIESMRDGIRSLLSKHRALADAQWAMGEDALRPLDTILEILQPTGIQERLRWLFHPGAASLGLNGDWLAEQEKLRQSQEAAAAELLTKLTPDELFSFAITITMRRELGVGIANSSVSDELKYTLMKRGMLASELAEAELGLGIFYGMKVRAGADGDSWVQSLWERAIAEEWGNDAELRIVQALPVDTSTWKRIEDRSSALSDAYWRSIGVFQIAGDSDFQEIVAKLLRSDRAIEAVGWLSHHIGLKPDGRLLVSTLYAAARVSRPIEGDEATMLSHNVGIILDYLDSDANVHEQEIASLEFIYFNALRYSRRSARTLHRALAQDPKLFVYFIKLVYFPEEESGVVEEEPANLEKAQGMASNAYHVLAEWTHVPGANEVGEIDGHVLETWVNNARKLLSDIGRSVAGDIQIGEILSAAKRSQEEPWPPGPVRDVIELVRSKELERGFVTGLYNRRGVTVRMPHDGGIQERVLVEQYRRDANELRFEWPRTAACLERIADMYDDEANREDVVVEQREWL
ncbi:helix-turn-helix domain-containing protein [Sodalis sp. RH15]|uniref:helix-turn-helix domain-containing protein n=1 Tax=Sodalis sp. RH15 TaxID=3394330 RepID=UPI0039B6A0ED